MERVSNTLQIDMEDVKVMLRYNILNWRQFIILTGMQDYAFYNRTMCLIRSKHYQGIFKVVYPFQDNHPCGSDLQKRGQQFVIRTPEVDKYIVKYLERIENGTKALIQFDNVYQRRFARKLQKIMEEITKKT